jgi:hypothetical protein
MLRGDLHVSRLTNARPPEPLLTAHVTVANPPVRAPFPDHIPDELDLSAEMVSRRDPLKLWANLRATTGWVARASSADPRSWLLRHRGKVEESLEWV